MFPLGSVLLPHMPLDLRIFDPRYLKMLGDLMLSDNPEFGQVLIERGREAGGGEKRFDIGTMAKVLDIGTTEEFYGLQSVGGQRFIVNSWLPDDPYPIADVDLLPDLVWSEELLATKDSLEQRVRKLLALASEFGDLLYPPTTQLSDDPIESCWQLAGILPVGPMDHLDLLKSLSAEELLAGIHNLVTTAEQDLNSMLDER